MLGELEVMTAMLLSAFSSGALEKAANILRQGGLVAFPTDTVYGVGAHAFLPEAVERLYIVKGRPRDKAIPLLLGKAEDMRDVAREPSSLAWRLAESFWPGGLTMVLFRKASVPDVVCAGGDTVAVRVPAHPLVLALIEAVGVPLATTSANRSGAISTVTAEEVQRELGNQIELILDGGRSPGGIPSTVIDLTGDPPVILRQGAILEECLRKVIDQS